MNNTTYKEILKIWNSETPDDFAIFSELYYEMFGGEEEIPYTTSSTCSSFFPYNWWKQQPQLIPFKLQNQMDLRLF